MPSPCMNIAATITNTAEIQYTTGGCKVIKPNLEAKKYPAVVVTAETVGM